MNTKSKKIARRLLMIGCVGVMCLLGIKIVMNIMALASEGINTDIILNVFRDVFAICCLGVISRKLEKSKIV